jgi:hypothetical protein
MPLRANASDFCKSHLMEWSPRFRDEVLIGQTFDLGRLAFLIPRPPVVHSP